MSICWTETYFIVYLSIWFWIWEKKLYIQKGLYIKAVFVETKETKPKLVNNNFICSAITTIVTVYTFSSKFHRTWWDKTMISFTLLCLTPFVSKCSLSSSCYLVKRQLAAVCGQFRRFPLGKRIIYLKITCKNKLTTDSEKLILSQVFFQMVCWNFFQNFPHNLVSRCVLKKTGVWE